MSTRILPVSSPPSPHQAMEIRLQPIARRLQYPIDPASSAQSQRDPNRQTDFIPDIALDGMLAHRFNTATLALVHRMKGIMTVQTRSVRRGQSISLTLDPALLAVASTDRLLLSASFDPRDRLSALFGDLSELDPTGEDFLPQAAKRPAKQEDEDEDDEDEDDEEDDDEEDEEVGDEDEEEDDEEDDDDDEEEDDEDEFDDPDSGFDDDDDDDEEDFDDDE
jgi:hypothetical protein